jgi:hypothetical protein
MAESEPLTGGRQSEGIVRIGETVRRPLHRNSEFVHALLRHLDAVGFAGAPRLLGIDEQGREILTFIEGEVYVSREDARPAEVLADAKLVSAARLIRRFHDATAGSSLAGDAQVVCHSDLGPHDIVFRGDQAVAIIDWEEDVAPGLRLLDFAHAVWCLAEIGEQGGNLAEQARRVRLLCDAYGWKDANEVIDEIEARFRRARSWHEGRDLAEGARIFGR